MRSRVPSCGFPQGHHLANYSQNHSQDVDADTARDLSPQHSLAAGCRPPPPPAAARSPVSVSVIFTRFRVSYALFYGCSSLLIHSAAGGFGYLGGLRPRRTKPPGTPGAGHACAAPGPCPEVSAQGGWGRVWMSPCGACGVFVAVATVLSGHPHLSFEDVLGKALLFVIAERGVLCKS